MNPGLVVDLCVVGIILLSALVAYFRGFVLELLSLAAWGGAAVITLVAFPYVQPRIEAVVGAPVVADGLTLAGVFVGALMVLSLMTYLIGRVVRASALSAVDRSLGFLFGMLRGAAVVVLLYIGLAWLVPITEQPEWLRTARTRPLAEAGARVLLAAIPKSVIDTSMIDLDGKGLPGDGKASPTGKKAGEGTTGDTVDPLKRPMGTGSGQPQTINNKGGEKNTETGYRSRERNEMERLSQNVK